MEMRPEGSGVSMTAEECARLPDGMHVRIIWKGGNGPHTYELARLYGLVFACLPESLVRVGTLEQAAQIWWDVEHPWGV